MHGKIKNTLVSSLTVAMLFLSGCTMQNTDISQDSSVPQEADTPQKDLTEFLYMDYADFEKLYKKQTISIGSYYMNESKIQNSRTVEFGYRSNTNFDNGKLVELTSDSICISDDEIMFSAWNYFKKNDSIEITGLNSIDEIWQQYGQPLWYIEERETAVLVFEVFDLNRSYYTVFYGKNGDYKKTEIDKDKKFSIPYRPQVTDEKIYLFTPSYKINNNVFLVTVIDLDNQKVELYTVSYEDMGLPDDTLIINPNNVFIDNNVMFLYANDYHNTGYIALYNFESEKGTNIEVKKDIGNGKLFRYGDGLGLMVSECINSDYSTTMGIRFFDYESKELRLQENENAYVEIAREAKYFYYIDGHQFYCVGDKLCGMMSSIDINTGKSETDVYVEISLPDGAVTTFIPLDINQFNFQSYTVRENGAAVSPHNVN